MEDFCKGRISVRGDICVRSWYVRGFVRGILVSGNFCKGRRKSRVCKIIGGQHTEIYKSHSKSFPGLEKGGGGGNIPPLLKKITTIIVVRLRHIIYILLSTLRLQLQPPVKGKSSCLFPLERQTKVPQAQQT